MLKYPYSCVYILFLFLNKIKYWKVPSENVFVVVLNCVVFVDSLWWRLYITLQCVLFVTTCSCSCYIWSGNHLLIPCQLKFVQTILYMLKDSVRKSTRVYSSHLDHNLELSILKAPQSPESGALLWLSESIIVLLRFEMFLRMKNSKITMILLSTFLWLNIALWVPYLSCTFCCQ